MSFLFENCELVSVGKLIHVTGLSNSSCMNKAVFLYFLLVAFSAYQYTTISVLTAYLW